MVFETEVTLLRLLAFWHLMIFLAAPVRAGISTDGEVQLEQGAEATGTGIGYAQAETSTNRELGEFKLSLPGNLKLQSLSELKFVWSPELQYSPWNDSPSERWWVELPEGYVQAKVDTWTLQAGYNTFTWGVMDVFNPIDVVNAHRYQDPFRSEKLGAPSLSLKTDLGPFTFEGLFIPWQRKTALPGNNSRWLPREVLNSRGVSVNGTPATVLLPSNISYSYQDSLVFDNALSDNYGGRIQGQGILSGLDVSAIYFEGAAPTPQVNLGSISVTSISYVPLIFQADPGVSLQPIYYRQRVFGGSLVYANFDMIFRFEAAVTRLISKSVTYTLPGNSQQYVLSGEHTFPIGEDSLTALAQLSYAQNEVPIENTVGSLGRIFDRTLGLGLRYSLGQKMTSTAGFVFDNESHDEYGHAEVSYSLSDAAKLGLAGDAFVGGLSSPLGTYHKNDRGIVSLKFLY